MPKIERSKTLTDIIAKLPELDRGELEHLRSRIGAKLHLAPSTPDLPLARNGKGPERDDCSFVLECVGSTLSSLGVEYAHAGMLRKSKGIGAFREKVPGILRYLENARLSRQQQHAMLCLGVELLYHSMTEMGLAISTRAILDHAHRIPSVINRAFPGYANTGTLGMILNARKKESEDVRSQRGNPSVSRSERKASGRR